MNNVIQTPTITWPMVGMVLVIGIIFILFTIIMLGDINIEWHEKPKKK